MCYSVRYIALFIWFLSLSALTQNVYFPVELFESFIVHKTLSPELPSYTVLGLPEKMVGKIPPSKDKIPFCLLGFFYYVKLRGSDVF